MQIAFRVDLKTEKGESIMRLANGQTWEVGDRFTNMGKTWTVDAVLMQYADDVPYPAEKLCLLIAGDRDTRSSLVVDARHVELVESDDV